MYEDSEVEIALTYLVCQILQMLCWTGTHCGIIPHINSKNPFMLSMHCIAHRLALASGQAADYLPYLNKYQQYTRQM